MPLITNIQVRPTYLFIYDIKLIILPIYLHIHIIGHIL